MSATGASSGAALHTTCLSGDRCYLADRSLSHDPEDVSCAGVSVVGHDRGRGRVRYRMLISPKKWVRRQVASRLGRDANAGLIVRDHQQRVVAIGLGCLASRRVRRTSRPCSARSDPGAFRAARKQRRAFSAGSREHTSSFPVCGLMYAPPQRFLTGPGLRSATKKPRLSDRERRARDQ